MMMVDCGLYDRGAGWKERKKGRKKGKKEERKKATNDEVDILYGRARGVVSSTLGIYRVNYFAVMHLECALIKLLKAL